MSEPRRRKPVPVGDTEDETSSTQANIALKLNQEPEFSWSSYSTWPLSLRFLPAYVALLGVFIATYWAHFMSETVFDTSSYPACVATFNYTFRINAARHQAEHLASHSWEYGIAAEAALELVTPKHAVFSAEPFPDGKVPEQGLKMDQALIWMHQRIRTDAETLFDDGESGGSASDPASLGVFAIMAGQRKGWDVHIEAAERQAEYLLTKAPKYVNGAISHRTERAELWSDAISMFPPFLAYLAVQRGETELMKEAVRQSALYRDVLRIQKGPKTGLWKHIAGPVGSEHNDDGAWSTGNGWAAHGMARVRATISGWETSNATMQQEIAQLDAWIHEILSAAISTDDHESGLLRNYLGDSTWFGETSGTALLAATAYRMAVLNPEEFATEKLLAWAHLKRQAVFDRVDDDGFVRPTVNPLKHGSPEPLLDGSSPEGESFLLLLGAAWRDCVCRGVCDVDTNRRY